MNTNQIQSEYILTLLANEHAKARVEAEKLWQKLKIAEEAMKPYKDAYDLALAEWHTAKGLADSLAACLKAREGRQ